MSDLPVYMKIPGVARLLLPTLQLLRHGGPKGLFRHYYMTNEWGDEESASGHGSTVEYTDNLRREIPNLLRRHDVKKMLDAPCGDYNWFRLIVLPDDVSYIGGDIVPEIVERNAQLFSNERTQFGVLDITRDSLPDVACGCAGTLCSICPILRYFDY